MNQHWAGKGVEVLTFSHLKDLEVLLFDKLIVVHQPIAGSFHFETDFVFGDSISEHAGEEPARLEIEDRDTPAWSQG